MKKKRPVHLNITKIKFPITAIISILHRISGVILFLFIPFLLWMLALSLKSPEGFAYLQHLFSGFTMKLTLWVLLSALIYHLLAGIRHLIMDAGWGETLAVARCSARSTLLLSIVLILLVGVWLW